MITGASHTHTRTLDSTRTTSRTGKKAAKVHSADEIRWDLVARIRAEIATGTFETPERINATVEALLDELDLVPAARTK
ncbi:MAG: hypothetical protein ACLFUJ_06180 [Phycisphaerae bacterium]